MRLNKNNMELIIKPFRGLPCELERLRNMLTIFKREYAKTNDEADSIQEVIEHIDRILKI